jgi:hypothetical protein
MGRCSCSGTATCACVVEGGDGIRVTGAGTVRNPYTIENLSVVERYIQTEDTPSLDLTLEGGGTPSNPFKLSGEATLALTDLTDVGDGQTPVTGDVPVWVNGHWEFQPPPSGGDGGGGTTGGLTSVTTGAGVTGQGTGISPLKAAVSGEWGSGSMTGFPTDKTLGTPVYVDNAGQLRARPVPIVRYAVNPIGSYGPGWSAADGTVLWYQQGPMVFLRVYINRSGTSISVGSGNDGNIANAVMATLASSLPKPLVGDWPMAVTATGVSFNSHINDLKQLVITALPPNTKITDGDGGPVTDEVADQVREREETGEIDANMDVAVAPLVDPWPVPKPIAPPGGWASISTANDSQR